MAAKRAPEMVTPRARLLPSHTQYTHEKNTRAHMAQFSFIVARVGWERKEECVCVSARCLVARLSFQHLELTWLVMDREEEVCGGCRPRARPLARLLAVTCVPCFWTWAEG